MSDAKTKAEECKSEGNAAFKAGDVDGAIAAFSRAIEIDPENAVYYSNRSMAALKAGKTEEALADANKCVELRPDWPKAYSRVGAALFHLGRLEDAEAAYTDGIAKVGGSDKGLEQALEQTQAEIARRASGAGAAGNVFGQLFGPDMWSKLALHPETRDLLADDDVKRKLTELQSNPGAIGTALGDPKVAKCLEVLLGIPMGAGAGGGDGPAGAAAQPPQPKKKEPEPEPEPEPELTPEERERADRMAKAQGIKEAGNALFKQRKFDEALKKYDEALEVAPEEGTFHNNRAAVLLMTGRVEECVAECDRAAEVGAADGGPATAVVVSKAYARKATALQRLGRLEDALAAVKLSLLEKMDRKVEQQRKAIEKAIKKAEEEKYIDPELSEKHKAQGAELFKAGKFPQAIEEFTEALKRDPDNFKARANRALCYTKLMQWEAGLADCDTIIKAHPEFVKAYLRKGKILNFLKRFDKALAAYSEGLKHDPQNAEILAALRETQYAMNTMSEEDRAARAKEAMKDPEIQAILADPMVHNVLRDLQGGDRDAAAKVANDPNMSAKIQRLIDAGVLSTK